MLWGSWLRCCNRWVMGNNRLSKTIPFDITLHCSGSVRLKVGAGGRPTGVSCALHHLDDSQSWSLTAVQPPDTGVRTAAPSDEQPPGSLSVCQADWWHPTRNRKRDLCVFTIKHTRQLVIRGATSESADKCDHSKEKWLCTATFTAQSVKVELINTLSLLSICSVHKETHLKPQLIKYIRSCLLQYNVNNNNNKQHWLKTHSTVIIVRINWVTVEL